jgi:hypothetical protein
MYIYELIGKTHAFETISYVISVVYCTVGIVVTSSIESMISP